MELKNTFKSRIKENRVGHDFYLAQIDNYTELTDTINKPIDKRFVQFYFCTRGMATFHFDEEQDVQLIKEGNSLLLFNPVIPIPVNISLSKKSKLIIYVVDIEFMELLFSRYKSFLPMFENNAISSVHKERMLSVQEKMILSQLENYSVKKEFENLYLTSKLNELLVYYFSYKIDVLQSNPYLEDEHLFSKFEEIKNILKENIANPPTLIEISEKMKMSKYKINEGFKKIYGKSISSFVLDTKLEIGRDKLEMKVKQVQEIAYDLGYENPSHFIEAFKKKYGVTPKQWMKR